MDIDDLIEDACEVDDGFFGDAPLPPEDWQEATATQPSEAAAGQPDGAAYAQETARPGAAALVQALPAQQLPAQQMLESQDVGASQMSCARAPRPKLVRSSWVWLRLCCCHNAIESQCVLMTWFLCMVCL